MKSPHPSQSADNRLSFPVAGLCTLLLGIVWVVSSSLTRRFCLLYGVSPATTPVVASLASPILAVVVVVCLEVWRTKTSPLIALYSLGFRPCTPLQLKITALGLAPILAGYIVIFSFLHQSPMPVPGVGLVVVKFIIAQGFGEEVIFRGFIFRHLRNGRSFWRASALSAVLFSLMHLANFTAGFTMGVFVSVCISMAFTLLLAFPLSALFELGAGSIFGSCVFHVAFDSSNFFTNADANHKASTAYLASILISGLVVLLASKRSLTLHSSPPSRPSRDAK